MTWCRQINGVVTTLPPNGVLALFLEDKMTKDSWLFWTGGGWKLRCESLGSLRYFRHGLVERGGDIVQVVNGADKSRKGVGTKDAWLFWGGAEVEM